jgi:6-pyruvoyltetrahydropterin/6-carboxytetrahydropterin synthase
MIKTVQKTYSNLKAAHRQHKHPGHCHFVHGENWTFHITFGCDDPDACGFVVDFGGLKGLNLQMEETFDHVLLIDKDDPEVTFFQDMHDKGLTDIRFVPSASAEGLAEYVFSMADKYVKELTNGRAWVQQVVCEEDPKNTATVTKDK